MASINDMQFALQRETQPGVFVQSAMRSYSGLRVKPGFNTEGNSFKGSGSRATTARTVTSDHGVHAVEAPQCFNAILPVAASLLGMPVSTPQGDAAHKHVLTLMGRGKRNPVSFSAVWGNDDYAMSMAYFLFQSLTFGVQRGDLTFDTSAISRTPDTDDATWPAGVEEIPAVPIPSRAYDVYIDDAWDALGTTQMLATYDASVGIGDTWGMDAPINSAIVSFAEAVENEDVDFTGSMQVGVKPAIRDMFTTFREGAVKYVRIAAEGPPIGDGAESYFISLDYPVLITSPGETDTAPNSSTVILPFEYELTPDPETGKLIELTVINTVASL